MTNAVLEAEPQHMLALDRANDVRLKRAEIKRTLSHAPTPAVSRRRAARVLLDPPDHVHGMPVDTLLRACRRMGPTSVGKLLKPHHVRENKPIGELTLRQRAVLAGELVGERAWVTA